MTVGTTIVGTGAADNLKGTSKSEVINGLGGGDTISGGAGNDTIIYYNDDVKIDGGSGTDYIDASNDSIGMEFDFNEMIIGTTSFRYVNVEGILAGSGNDTLLGNALTNLLFGNAGADYLSGGKGKDTLSGGAGNDTYFFTIGDGSDVILASNDNSQDMIVFANDILQNMAFNDAAFSQSGQDLLIKYSKTDSIKLQKGFNGSFKFGMNNAIHMEIGTNAKDSLYGSNDNDYLNGGLDKDYLDGGLGDDTIYGGKGDDTIVYDSQDSVINGGDGFDILDASAANAGIGIALAATLPGGILKYGKMEKVCAGAWNDTLIGDSLNNWLEGGQGNDILDGSGGKDTLSGGLGSDTYMFGKNYGADIIVANDENNLDTIEFVGNDINATDIVFTASGNNMVITMKGNRKDSLTIKDWFTPSTTGSYDNQINQFMFASGISRTYKTGGKANDVEFGSPDDDTISGGSGNDTIYGYAGNDYLKGDDGSDMLIGGIGNDTLVGGKNTDTYIFADGFGSDVIASDSYSSVDTIRLEGSMGAKDFKKDGKNLILVCENGDNITMVDWFRGANYKITNISGNDEFGEWKYKLNLATTGDPEAGNKLTAKAGELLLGLGGNDTLFGGLGNDGLYGGLGNDVIFGGIGNDVLSGGAGDDQFKFSNDSLGSDVILDFGNGNDQIEFTWTGAQADFYTIQATGNDLLLQDTMGGVVRLIDVVDEAHSEIRGLVFDNNEGSIIWCEGNYYWNDMLPHSSLAVSDATIVESGALQFAITRSGYLGDSTTVDFATSNGTAMTDSDYTAANGTITFAVGETTKTINITTIDDGIIEGNETLTVNLSNASNGGILLNSTAIGIIIDNDVTLAISDATVAEGNTLQFTVTRSGSTTIASTVDFATANGTAAAGNDYIAQNGTVSFGAGETSKTISIATIDDSLIEGNETLAVNLSNASNGGTLLNSSAIGTINDNDLAVEHHFSIKFDYRYDTAGFFSDPARKAALETAASYWSNYITDDFPTVASGTSINVWNPETGAAETLNIDSNIDDLLIFVGSATPPFTTSSSNAWAAATYCGVSTDVSLDSNDFEPYVGSISFNAIPDSVESGAQWFFDSTPTTTDDLPANDIDFISVAMHEIGHVLGISIAPIFDMLDVNGFFTGSNSESLNGGNPIPLTADGHVQADFGINSYIPLMDPYASTGERSFTTELDMAMLTDIGYNISSFTDLPLTTEEGDKLILTYLADTVHGLGGDDYLSGGNGDDCLYGDDGNDTLLGGAGNETLYGGSGDDLFWGNAGNDCFVVEPSFGTDNIQDFVHGEDKIVISEGIGYTDSIQVYNLLQKTGTWGADNPYYEISLTGGKIEIFADKNLSVGDFVIQ